MKYFSSLTFHLSPKAAAGNCSSPAAEDTGETRALYAFQ